MLEYCLDFAACENHRYSAAAFCANDALDLFQRLLEDTIVEKHNGIKCLILGGRRNVAANGEKSLELGDVPVVKPGGVLIAVKADIKLDPLTVSLLRLSAVVKCANSIAHTIDQTWLFHERVPP